MSSRPLLITAVVLFVLAIAMSLYVWQLRNSAPEVTPAALAEPVTPPKKGPADKITLWLAYDKPGSLRSQVVAVPAVTGRQQQATQIVAALVDFYTAKNSPHPLRPGSEIHNVFVVDPGLVVLDVNAAFVDGQTSGVLAEELTVASLFQSLNANITGLTQFKILVDGKERDTLAGHADLSGTYDGMQLAALAKELSSQ